MPADFGYLGEIDQGFKGFSLEREIGKLAAIAVAVIGFKPVVEEGTRGRRDAFVATFRPGTNGFADGRNARRSGEVELE